MSDEYFKEIAERVKSGEYFQDAHDWYQNKYLNPVVERAYFILLAFLSVTLIVIAFATLISFLPLKMWKPLLINVSDQTAQYVEFRSLGNRRDVEEDPNPIVQQYMLSKFIDAYESYDFRNDFQRLTRNENIVTSMATDEVLAEYKNYTGTTNPNSPLLRLRSKGLLMVNVPGSTMNIERIATIGEEGKNSIARYAATVDFSVQEISMTGSQESKWRAKVNFTYKEVRYDRSMKDFPPMEFKVVSYASEKVK